MGNQNFALYIASGAMMVFIAGTYGACLLGRSEEHRLTYKVNNTGKTRNETILSNYIRYK